MINPVYNKYSYNLYSIKYTRVNMFAVRFRFSIILKLELSTKLITLGNVDRCECAASGYLFSILKYRSKHLTG